MPEFRLYLEIGLRHVLDINGYDHILFLMALSLPYAFKDWRRVLLLVTIFTIGHTASLLLSVFNIVTIKADLVEFLILITIITTALFSLFTAGKPVKSNNINITGFITLFFGIIHGLGFSNYFKSILEGSIAQKLVPTLEFALGIELAQVVVVLTVLLLSIAFQNFLKFSRRDFVLVFSALIVGMVLPMIIQNDFWK